MAGKVLSIGQCAADAYLLAEWFRRHWGAECRAVEDAGEALDLLREFRPDLVLVNRVFDRDGASGLELIGRLQEDPALAALPVMLVSNYPEAQAQAVSAGALAGFGKAQLEMPRTLERVAAALAGAERTGREGAP